MRLLRLSALLAVCAAVSPALAADEVMPTGKLVAAPGAWSGFYAGAGVSLSGTEMDFPDGSVSVIINGASVGDDNTEGAIRGHVLGGYLFQSGRLLFGGEADLEFGNEAEFEGAPTFSGGEVCSPRPCGRARGIGSFQTYGHVRAVLGYELNPRAMGFVAAGAAIGEGVWRGIFAEAAVEGASSTSQATFDPVRETMVGYSIGGGAQIKATERIVIRGEALFDFYSDFDVNDVSVGAGSSNGTDSVNSNIDTGGSVRFRNTTVRLSLIYRF
jgi:opacity protein-like surface antigen